MASHQKLKGTFKLSRLALKIIAAISISVLAIQLAFIGYIEKRISESELAKVSEEQETFTQASAMYISELIAEDNLDNLYLLLSSVVANPHIVRATLDYKGSEEPLYVGQEITELKYAFDVNDLDENDDLVTIGTLTTYATTEFVDEAHEARIQSILGLALIVFLVVLGVSVLAVQSFIGIPLKRITKAISEHSGVPKIQWDSNDEMGTVVSRLNFLHEELSNKLTGLEEELSIKERREAARISSLANATLEGILIFKDGHIVDLNGPMARLFGADRDALIGEPISNWVNKKVQRFLEQSVPKNTRPHTAATISNAHKQQIPVEIHLTSMEDESSYSHVAVVRDISERLASEEAMWRLAHYDSLTNLPNRRYFSEKLSEAVELARYQNTTLSVAYLDLDNFKFVNDSRGHAVGDQLLCKVSESMRNSLGENGLCARLGGDEFAIFFEEESMTSPLEEILEKILDGIQHGEECRAWNSIFGVSIGAATLKGDEVSESELLTRADLALYKAKETGRARICYYSDNIDAKLKRERLIEERLGPALEGNKLQIRYQPQVLCNSFTITGFEALLRWEDPLLGSVSPDEIIEIADRVGLVLQLGRWVISKACEDASAWPGELRLAVNLSPLQLIDEDLPSFISECLERTGLPPSQFEVEITETALVSDTGQAHKNISTFKDMGILIALDDFGTGYSSLSMLQKFPFDRIKIDRAFVANLGEDSGKAAIVASIIDLSSRLGLRVIAEGVETERDIVTLKDFHCPECQGYLISGPVPLEKVPSIISQFGGPSEKERVVVVNGWQKAG